MASLSAVLLGLINIAIVVALMLLVGAVGKWLLDGLGYPVPLNVRKLFLLVVALVALYMLVALLFGLPTLRIISSAPALALAG